MAEQIGIIREKNDEGWAVVETDRQNACGGCHSGRSDGCHSCLAGSGSKLESRAANPIGAQVGDVVKINLPTTDLFKGAFILYLLPVMCLLAAALAGSSLAGAMGFNETTGAVVAGIIGVVAGVGLVLALDRTSYVRRHMMPTITAVVPGAAGRLRNTPPVAAENNLMRNHI